MPKQRRVCIDDLATKTAELLEQVRVLVAAVDDLRCEVEWWARNATEQAHSSDKTMSPTERIAHQDSPVDWPPPVLPGEAVAAERLSAVERSLMSGPPGVWPDEECYTGFPELPTGFVVPVDEEIWADVVDLRPSHVVRMGCCCGEESGTPELLAWESGSSYFLREMTEQEAGELQAACLAQQRAAAVACSQKPAVETEATQLGLWQE